MNARLFLFIILLYGTSTFGQDISGYWQGVNYAPGSRTSDYWSGYMHIIQNGNTIRGTLYFYAPNKPQHFVEFEISGTIQNNSLQLQAGRIIRENRLDDGVWCLDGRGTLVYNPIEESLKGSLSYTNCSFNGNLEFYALKPKTKTTYCKYETVRLEVTGKDIRWYDDENKTNLIARGNVFEPQITTTTTFYATQTHYSTESPAVPVKLEITQPEITGINLINTSCNIPNGLITINAEGAAPLRYSIDQSNNQTSNEFKNLAAGSYNVTVSDKNNCKTEQSVKIAESIAPIIDEVKLSSSTCGKENASIEIKASGGEPPLQFSINITDFAPSNLFINQKPGEYDVQVKDAKGCINSKNVKIAPSENPRIIEVKTVPANCTKENGEILIKAEGGIAPLTYSIDNNTFFNQKEFTDLKKGTYEVSVKDSNNCLVSKIATIIEDCRTVFYLPKAFSPNGDGINDTFTIHFPMDSLEVKSFVIINRLGTFIYTRDKPFVLKSGDTLWKGDGNEKNFGSETYLYILTIISQTNKPEIHSDSITILK